MRERSINSAFESFTPQKIKQDIKYEILPFINKLKDLRNENVHGKSATLKEAKELRELIIGVDCSKILALAVKLRIKISTSKGV